MPIWIYNCGVGGDTSKEILSRLQKDVLDRNPDYITLTFGMNDTGYSDVFNNEKTDSLSAERISKSVRSYSKIVETLKDYRKDAKVVMIGGSPYDETSKFNDSVFHGKNEAIGRIISIQEQTAKENDWGFVDSTLRWLRLPRMCRKQIQPTHSVLPTVSTQTRTVRW